MDASANTSLSDELLLDLQRLSFEYFLRETNPANGLVADRNASGSPASIAAVGLALSSYPVGVERGFMTRAAAVERTLATLRFFWNAPHGPKPDATGHKGFLRLGGFARQSLSPDQCRFTFEVSTCCRHGERTFDDVVAAPRLGRSYQRPISNASSQRRG